MLNKSSFYPTPEPALNLPMVIDDHALRATEIRRLHEWRGKTARLERVIDRFETIDRKKYDAWYATEIAPLAATVSALAAEHRRAVEFHAHVVALANLDNLTMRQAYRRLRAEEVRFDAGDPDVRARIEAERARREHWLHGEPPRDEEGASGRRRRAGDPNFEFGDDDRFGGAFERDEDAADDHDFDRSIARPQPPSVDPARVQSAFRRVSRKIHPDLVTGRLAARGPTWLIRAWSEAVDARRAGDLNRLTRIEAEIAYAEHGTESLSVSELRALVRHIAETHGRTECEAARLRSHAAWGFNRKRDLGPWAARLRGPLEIERRALRFSLNEIEGWWRRWGGT